VKRFAGVAVLAGISLLARNKPFEQVLKSVPEKARLKRNPMAGDPDAKAAGGKLFEQHCAGCHGRASEGGRKAPSLVGMEMQRATPGEIFSIITNGVVRHGMPSWSRLPEPERWQIVTFLRSNPSQSPLADVPEEARKKPNPIAGDSDAPADGGKLFARYCAQCHGAAANGVGKAPSLVNSRIQHATPGELFWVITNGATVGGMPSWSKLTETQRWQIVAFLTTINRPRDVR
jgi:cytochrome c oxidase cbb3-type subunit 2